MEEEPQGILKEWTVLLGEMVREWGGIRSSFLQKHGGQQAMLLCRRNHLLLNPRAYWPLSSLLSTQALEHPQQRAIPIFLGFPLHLPRPHEVSSPPTLTRLPPCFPMHPGAIRWKSPGQGLFSTNRPHQTRSDFPSSHYCKDTEARDCWNWKIIFHWKWAAKVRKDYSGPEETA